MINLELEVLGELEITAVYCLVVKLAFSKFDTGYYDVLIAFHASQSYQWDVTIMESEEIQHRCRIQFTMVYFAGKRLLGQYIHVSKAGSLFVLVDDLTCL